MTDNQITSEEKPTENIAPKSHWQVNSLTVVLVLAFLLVLLAETVGASALFNDGEGGFAAKDYDPTKLYESCINQGKTAAKCNLTMTAYAKKTPTQKACYPYKQSRPVVANESITDFITYYKMTAAERDEFIKINSLSPAYPNTLINAGKQYCLPYGVERRVPEWKATSMAYDVSKDFGFTVRDILAFEIEFDIYNIEKNDRIDIWYWNKPPGASRWHCEENVDGNCIKTVYNETQNEKFDDGYSDARRKWLGAFRVSTSPIMITFPTEVFSWNYVYVCFHSTFRSELDDTKDPKQGYPTYHSYCQLINMHRPHTTMIPRLAADWSPTPSRTPTAMNTPCGWNPLTTAEVCMPPCPGTKIPSPTNTACPGYTGGCPGLRRTEDPPYERINTPTHGPHSTPCTPYWLPAKVR